MKRLRILTGRHVGSMLDLAEGVHRVGLDADCDVAISDWDEAVLQLTVQPDGVHFLSTAAAPSDADAAEPARAGQLADFAAQRFGRIVLCVGPVGTDWPSDVELLEAVFQPTPARVMRWARGRPGGINPLAAGAAAAAVVLGVFAWVLLAGPAEPPPPTLDMARLAIQQAVDKIQPGALRIAAVGGRLHVDGLVETTLQAAQARAVIDAARGTHPVDQRFAAASDVADAMRAALGAAAATITHDGHGGFTIAAEVSDTNTARQVIDRMRSDLGPVVRSVETRFEVTGAKRETPILSRMNGDGISFVQTRDGVKHLAVRSADESPITVSEALALPSPLTPTAPAPVLAPQNRKDKP